MALDLGSIKNELDTIVNDATSVADLVEKYSATVQKFAGLIPGVGTDVSAAVGLVNVIDKALHELQSVLKDL